MTCQTRDHLGPIQPRGAQGSEKPPSERQPPLPALVKNLRVLLWAILPPSPHNGCISSASILFLAPTSLDRKLVLTKRPIRHSLDKELQGKPLRLPLLTCR